MADGDEPAGGGPWRDRVLSHWGLLGLGVLAESVGAIWVLQGTNVLPGSLLSGQPAWAIVGGAVAAFGMVLVLLAIRRKDEG